MEIHSDIKDSQDQKNVLIVFAHQDKKSFNGALLETAKHELEQQGHSVQISDLYAQEFEPRATHQDILGNLEDRRVFSYGEEGKYCYQQEEFSQDILSEIAKLKAADLVIFQFPLYWSSTPAILKGWFDRILVDGFAFNFETRQILDKGLMAGKRALLSLTTGGSREMLSELGVSGDINVLLWPIQYGILRICGFDVLPPHVSYATPFVGEESRIEYLSQWKHRLSKVWTDNHVLFPTISDFSSTNMTLTDDYLNRTKQCKYAPSVGHHLHMPLPEQKDKEYPKQDHNST